MVPEKKRTMENNLDLALGVSNNMKMSGGEKLFTRKLRPLFKLRPLLVFHPIEERMELLLLTC